ncbi:ribosomal RNA large subunit methyltransferase H [Alsobacter metallidurans]|uniref:Ribosomal RNA large subunit methyltransferase H n=1 Tax=Alsobacter metallidurans TaxID=340221 RepID=A0A917IAT5_9HYPH|nr:23S rRNA (pseudouridine(1915)-N(3))-methyltransferase RlmH [Alsobacter metallidurans]GGH31592.1 ribosomal RNA large subunit methyltransferase H [Alsobacter metallidurans]
MRIAVIAVGRLKDGPERELVARYDERARASGRTLGFTGFEAFELAESRASRPADRKAEEAAAIRSRLAGLGDPAVIALDERGANPTSEAFAQSLASRRDAGLRSLALLIGGADGLDPALAAQAQERVSFGRMTLPHQLVRVLAAEQLYRAMTILSGHPYHRA